MHLRNYTLHSNRFYTDFLNQVGMQRFYSRIIREETPQMLVKWGIWNLVADQFLFLP